MPLILFPLPLFSWEPQVVMLTIRQFHMDLWQYLVQWWHFSQVACHQYEVYPKGVTSAGCGEYKGVTYKQPWKICRKLDQYQTSTKSWQCSNLVHISWDVHNMDVNFELNGWGCCVECWFFSLNTLHSVIYSRASCKIYISMPRTFFSIWLISWA